MSVSRWHQLREGGREGGSDTDASSSLFRGDRDSQSPGAHRRTLPFPAERHLGVKPIPGFLSPARAALPAILWLPPLASSLEVYSHRDKVPTFPILRNFVLIWAQRSGS